MTAVVGRDRELGTIRSFLELADETPRILLLEGEAGIGKTALWRAGMDSAASRGCRVLASSAAESETQLAFTTVRDLLGDVFDEVADELPVPQRYALAVVLLREEPTDGPAEPKTVSVAFLTTLRLLASRTLALLAVDDVPWVDAASADVLRYVLRRLDAAGAKALLARRTGDSSELLLPGMQVLEVGPFSVGALGRILHDRLGVSYPRRTLQRVHAVSGGNPFYALEIGRALGNSTGTPHPGEQVPVPGSLLQLVRKRLVSLPAATFDVLALASALSRPTLQTIGRALDADARPAFQPAVDAEIVQTDDMAVRFSHPLFAASVYELAGQRHAEIHARLAQVVDDVEERARHLVRAAVEPGAAVSAAIDEGAAAAAARGAPGAAAELGEAAARLTPPDAPKEERRRRLEAADWHQVTGDARAARALLEPLAADLQPGPERARVLVRLAAATEPSAGVPLLEQALDEAEGNLDLLAEIQVGLAQNMLSTHGARADLAAAIRATELAELAENRELITEAKGKRLLVEAFAGSPVDPEVAAWASGQFEAYRDHYPPALSAALWLMYRDRLDEARSVLHSLAGHAAAHGEEDIWSTTSLHLAELECRAGRYAIAAEHAEEARAFDLGELDQPLSAVLYATALADAYRGRVDEARAGAELGLKLARGVGDTIFDVQNEGVLGFLDVSLGEARAAADRLAPLWPRLVELGYGEPSAFPVLPNAIHALLEAGDRGTAERLLDQLEERGRALDSAWALSQATRLRALVAADTGRMDEALALFDEALVLHERMPGPFERGRTLLARGAVLRRARRRRDARDALQQALAIFDDLGTPLWAEKTLAELARIGGRAPAGDELTPSERRIAELVADGKTNKEVAAILVVADRTVESALTQIYRKLDVRSRTELARKLASEPDAGYRSATS
jgi:DNA-binding CsgD family transcriptional regulator